MPNRNAARQRANIDRLEPRLLFSSSFTNVNITKMRGNQAEGAITIDPTNSSREFVATNIDSGDGLAVAISSNGGASWTSRTIADDSDSLPPACCDPTASFDQYGNLFLGYLNSADNQVVLLMSTDGGQSFSVEMQINGVVDQPTVVTGPGANGVGGSVWLTFQKANVIVATGAAVTGSGDLGSFTPLQKIRGSGGGNFGDIEVGASGQVILTYQQQISGVLSKIFVATDPTGLSDPHFGNPILVSTTTVPLFDYIAAQPDRSVDAEAGLAYDRSGGAFNGRIYLMYTNEIPAASGNLDIFIRYSDNGGATWSDAARVNDDQGLNSQFLPKMAIDQTTGMVAVSWYDCRNDTGNGNAFDTDNTPNDDAVYDAAVVTSQPDGLDISANQQISAGVSDAYDANSSIDFGDYTGLAFSDNQIAPLWFDNSNSTGDNPNGTLKGLNGYTAMVSPSAFSGGTFTLGGFAAVGPVVSLYVHPGDNTGSVAAGKIYTITLAIADANTASLGNGNLLVTGPNGFSVDAMLEKTKQARNGPFTATYNVSNPSGLWQFSQDGTYAFSIASGQIADASGQTTTPGILGTFAVTTNHGRGSHAGGTGHRHHKLNHD